MTEMMSQITLADLVDIEYAKLAFGKTEYRYEKRWIEWVGRDRRESPPVACSREEFDQFRYEGLAKDGLRMVGTANLPPQSFWRYYRIVTKKGWREQLIDMIQIDGKFS